MRQHVQFCIRKLAAHPSCRIRMGNDVILPVKKQYELIDLRNFLSKIERQQDLQTGLKCCFIWFAAHERVLTQL